MYSSIPFRTGDAESLAAEFLQKAERHSLKFVVDPLEKPNMLIPEEVLAVHFADGGAQGDAGAVAVLYASDQGIRILYGNYAYGGLNLDTVIQKLPMLKCLDSRNTDTLPYPFGGNLELPSGWRCLYMGALNYFLVREELLNRAGPFLDVFLKKGRSWQVFDAIAYFCGAQLRET